tara:strand:+ start:1110 stop:1337 length:228 start_codon:yes stop_codon:yes gene_type:complete
MPRERPTTLLRILRHLKGTLPFAQWKQEADPVHQQGRPERISELEQRRSVLLRLRRDASPLLGSLPGLLKSPLGH